MQLTTKIRLLAGIAVVFSTAAISRADSFTQTYSGVLSDPSQVVEETFTLNSPSQLLLTTSSYGGGSNTDGTSSVAGGFQPNLTLYTSAGNYVASQIASSPIAATDIVTVLALDSYLIQPSLGSGSYIVTLTNWETQQPPTVTNLSGGFVNYGGSLFTDESGAARTGSYSLNISASPAAVASPEPGTSAIMALGLVLLVAPVARRFVSASAQVR